MHKRHRYSSKQNREKESSFTGLKRSSFRMKTEETVTLSLSAIVVQEIISALAFQNRYLRKDQHKLRLRHSSGILSTSDVMDTENHSQDLRTSTNERSDIDSKCVHPNVREIIHVGTQTDTTSWKVKVRIPTNGILTQNR